jgi:hypothetical protein
MLSNFLKFGLFPLLLVGLGCATMAQPNPRAFDGVSGAYPNATRQLADDAAQGLGSAFSPGTKFSVNTETEFGQALDEALRRNGFSLAAGGINVHYSVDLLQNASSPSGYVHLVLPDGASLSQIYNLSSEAVTPAGNMVKAGLPDFELRPLAIPPAAGASEASYTLEALPESLTLGQAADVVFTLKRDGQPVTGSLKPRFEGHPSFPNLKTTARTLDKNGAIIVKGLRPGQAGLAHLRLVIDKNAYAEAAVTVTKKQTFSETDLPATADPAIPVLPSVPPKAVTSEKIPEPETTLPPPSPALRALEATHPPTVGPAVQAEEWSIAPGLLRGQLENWSVKAGYQMVWKARHDFEMQSPAVFRDDFVGAVKRLFLGLHKHGNLLKATIYQDNRVLEVMGE